MTQGTGALIDGLAERFRGADESLRLRCRLTIGRCHPRDVVVEKGRCSIESPSGKADAEIITDTGTWLDMYEGRLSGIEAFTRNRVAVRGSIEHALRFEPLFDRPAAGGLEYSMERVKVGKSHISTLVAGPEDADPLILIHGLGASKSSWLTVVPPLAERYRVLAIDLPGFGASSKPRGRYDAPWFADAMLSFLDELGYESAFFAGNSMGGRVAIEVAMTEPERVRAIACLCPAAAFARRPALWLVRLSRPELGFFGARLPRGRLTAGLRQLFADPACIEADWYEAAIDDFVGVWRSPRARMAFFAAARNIYLDEPFGESGFWKRLERMETPSLYIYGEHDVLITPRFGQRISRALPTAEVHTWDDCGHVPQIEFPERTTALLTDFFGRAKAPTLKAV